MNAPDTHASYAPAKFSHAIVNQPEDTMKDPIIDLADMICETLVFCYKTGHKRSLGRFAREEGATLEQIVSAALAQRISESFEVRLKAAQSDSDPRSTAE